MSRNHFSACPHASDPTTDKPCLCPPGIEPRLNTPEGDTEFSLSPPPVLPAAEGGKAINRKGETRAQATARLRRMRSGSMIRKFGPGPAAMKCGTCQFLVRRGGGARDYAKCLKYGASHSEATDWSSKWLACALYTSK